MIIVYSVIQILQDHLMLCMQNFNNNNKKTSPNKQNKINLGVNVGSYWQRSVERWEHFYDHVKVKKKYKCISTKVEPNCTIQIDGTGSWLSGRNCNYFWTMFSSQISTFGPHLRTVKFCCLNQDIGHGHIWTNCM